MSEQWKHSLEIAPEGVEEIVTQLQRAGALNDPRPFPRHTVPLADYVRAEIRRSAGRMLLAAPKLPPEYASKVEEGAAGLRARFKKQRVRVKALRKAGLTAEADRVAHEIWWEPPNRADTPSYKCAGEAYDLVNHFSVKAPTGTITGPFCMITGILLDAVGEGGTDVKRACDFVLRNRRRYA
jgi:hypothetical protein